MPSISVPTAIIGSAVLGAGASVASGLIGSNAAQSAANTQAQSAQNALNTQVGMFNVAENQLAPFTTVGTGAINQLANIYGIPYGTAPGAGGATASALPQTLSNGIVVPANANANAYSPGGQSVQNAAMQNFTHTPDYQFAFQQGLQALQRSAAAQGNLVSGGQMKAAQEFGQGLASQQFGNYFNRLLSLGQIGQSAAAGTAQNALTAGGQIGNTQQAIGQAQASGIVGSANALTGALGGVANAGTNAVNQQLISKLYGLPQLGGNTAQNSNPSAFAQTSNALGGSGPVALY